MHRFFVAVSITLMGSTASAGPAEDCDRLEVKARARADALLAHLNPYDCCDQTLAECLTAEPPCPLVVRLANNVCRRVAAGETDEAIERVLVRRARSMMHLGKPRSIALDGLPVLGDANAPVTVVMYACARCPYCARLTPKLHGAITGEPLAGKVKLIFKLFPIRSHEHSKEAGMAVLAAARMGKLWDYLLPFYARFNEYSPDKQVPWAEDIGLDPVEFGRLSRDAEVREQLVASKKEGLKNGVDATPTLFIDGYEYQGELKIEEIIDVLEEAYERAAR